MPFVGIVSLHQHEDTYSQREEEEKRVSGISNAERLFQFDAFLLDLVVEVPTDRFVRPLFGVIVGASFLFVVARARLGHHFEIARLRGEPFADEALRIVRERQVEFAALLQLIDTIDVLEDLDDERWLHEEVTRGEGVYLAVEFFELVRVLRREKRTHGIANGIVDLDVDVVARVLLGIRTEARRESEWVDAKDRGRTRACD